MTDAKKTPARLVIYPVEAMAMLGVTKSTLWKWERAGKLPARDVFVGGVAVGWKPATLQKGLSTPNPEAQEARRAPRAARLARGRELEAARRRARRQAEGQHQGEGSV